MKKTLKRKIAAGLCAYFCAGSIAVGNCASPADFKTEEYRQSTGLDIINAADAYALGYTGMGITLGICDDYVKFSHPEFAAKKAPMIIGMIPWDYDWTKENHGSHVAGTMAAAKDGNGMHGLAFDAELVSGRYQKDDGMALYQAIKGNAQVKIINNSWGYPNYSDTEHWTRDDINEVFSAEGILFFDIMEQSIVQDDKVVVFAAGNFGHTAPSVSSMLSYVRPAMAKSFINVTSVDPWQYSIERSAAGTAFISIFSDLTKYVEENSIAAPGSAINSVSAGDDGYTQMFGTSMAAPHVSAAAGLVQQAFPYMDGKMLTDTVLSSANADFQLPGFMLTVQEDGEEKRVNLYYFEGKQSTFADDLAQYYVDNQWIIEGFYGLDQNAWLSLPVNIYENVPREMLFGQGLLDVGAAVRGPGLLNARRMDRTNFSEAYGTPQALYSVDTQGWNSVWSNDIGEKRAGLLEENSAYDDLRKIYNYYKQDDALNGFIFGQQYIDDYNQKVAAAGLQDLPVGLLKEGLGTLALTGNNTYTGGSIAAGGVLQIDGSVAADAWSVGEGTIAGSGTIKGDLVNHGAVRAGSWGAPGVLTVGGDFHSDGAIAVAVRDGAAGLIDAKGTAAIDGSRFAAVPGSVYIADSVYRFLEAQDINGAFVHSALTGMLSADGSHDGKQAVMQVTRQNNIRGLTAPQLQTYGAMEAMYDYLGQSARQREMDALYNLSPDAAKQAMTELYGGAQANLAGSLQQNNMLGQAVAARLDAVKTTLPVVVDVPMHGFAANDFTAKAVIPLELDAADSWWLKMSKGWNKVEADNDLPSLDGQSFGLMIGRDKQADENWRIGGVFAYGTNKVGMATGEGENQDYRVGVYGGYHQGALDIRTYLDYGRQKNDATRYLLQLGLRAESNYDSDTFGFGAEVGYDLTAGREKVWQVRPYLGVDAVRYSQNAYNESGAGVYSQQADQFDNTYMTAQTGLKLRRILKESAYEVNVGYKRVLSGADPSMMVSFAGNPGGRLKIDGNQKGKEFLVIGLSAAGKLSKDWTIDANLETESSGKSDNLVAELTVRRHW